MNPATQLLAQLDAAVILGRPSASIKTLHDALLKWLQHEKNPAPDWDEYPVGRSFFTQYYK